MGCGTDDCAGDGIIFGNRLLEKDLQRFPGAAAQIDKELSIIQEVTTKDLRDTEHEMPVMNIFEDIQTNPFSEFHHALLMAGRTKVPPFARKGQKVFMAAIQIPINNLMKIRPPESILPREMFIIDMDKSFKIILYTAVIIRILRVSGPVFAGGQRHIFLAWQDG